MNTKLGEGSTPGPWQRGRLDEQDVSQWITDAASRPIDLGVAKVYGDDIRQVEANARLIAKAPLLVEAIDKLARLEQWIRDLSEQTDASALDQLNTLRRGYCKQYENTRTLLAKLEGE